MLQLHNSSGRKRREKTLKNWLSCISSRKFKNTIDKFINPCYSWELTMRIIRIHVIYQLLNFIITTHDNEVSWKESKFKYVNGNSLSKGRLFLLLTESWILAKLHHSVKNISVKNFPQSLSIKKKTLKLNSDLPANFRIHYIPKLKSSVWRIVNILVVKFEWPELLKGKGILSWSLREGIFVILIAWELQ